MKILVTGVRAGFVCAKSGKDEIVVLDNLRRRGSELNITRLKEIGIELRY